jgi:2-polyprenyl-3-methyl-5-hydroxy-6-metoxy-1,4-benzoquinol methylase
MVTVYRATDRLFRTTASEFFVFECAQCRFMRLFPQPTLKESQQYYPDDYFFAPAADTVSQLAELYRQTVLLDHVRFVRGAVASQPKGSVLLDVGCSGGLLPRMLRDRGIRAMGLDNSFSAARTAWRVNGVPAICSDFLKCGVREGSCGVVSMFHVLEHVPDPPAYLSRARTLLRPGGRLVIQVPNAASWQFLLFAERWNGLDVPRHLWNFRTKDLEWLLRDTGFRIRRRKHFSLRDNPAGMATSFSPDLDPMARRVRRVAESPLMAAAKNLAYLALTLACLPFAALEAAFQSGSTIMIEAERD